MTTQPIIDDVPRVVSYPATASAGPFIVSFPLFDKTGADLLVEVNGVPQTGWSFTAEPAPGFFGAPNTFINCTVTLAAPVTGIVTFTGRRRPRRPGQFQEGRGVPARDTNTELNQLTAIARELLDQVLDLEARTVGRSRAFGSEHDAGGLRIRNGADPVDAQDFVTRHWAETTPVADIGLAALAKAAAQASASAAAQSAANAVQATIGKANKSGDTFTGLVGLGAGASVQPWQIIKFGSDQVGFQSVTDPSSGVGRIDVKRFSGDRSDSFADVYLYKNTVDYAEPPGAGGSSNMLKIEQEIGAHNVNQWPLTVSIKVRGASAGANHVAAYVQAWRFAAAPTWGECIECRDYVVGSDIGFPALEVDMWADGIPGIGARIGIDMVYGSATEHRPGDNVVSQGIRIGPFNGVSDWTDGRAVLLRGIEIRGNVLKGLDLTGMNQTLVFNGENTRAVVRPDGLLDTWGVTGASFGFAGDSMVVNPPTGGLGGAGAVPANCGAKVKVNVGGYGVGYLYVFSS